jgi:DNA-binding transcriptional ArsR family regulator
MSDVPLDSTDGRSGTAPDTMPSVTPDDAFAALADPRRRTVLTALREHTGDTMTIETLVDRVVSQEAPSAATRRHVHTSIADVELPKLDDWGLIEYDSAQETVRYVASPLVEGLLTHVTENER